MPSTDPIVTVHRLDPGCDPCGTDETCEQFTTVDTDPTGGYVIGKVVTDPAVLAAHAKKIGPGEQLLRLDRAIAPDVWS